MPSSVRRVLSLAACCGLVLMLSGAALPNPNTLTNLVSNLTGKAKPQTISLSGSGPDFSIANSQNSITVAQG